MTSTRQRMTSTRQRAVAASLHGGVLVACTLLLAAFLAPGAAPAMPGPARVQSAVAELRVQGARLAWDGIELGMTTAELERVVGELPEVEVPESLLGCEAPYLSLVHRGQPLELELATESGEARVQAVWLLLAPGAADLRAAGPALDPALLRAALKARLPGLAYVPSIHAPEVPEIDDAKPLYRTPQGELVWIDPTRGIYFGEICLD